MLRGLRSRAHDSRCGCFLDAGLLARYHVKSRHTDGILRVAGRLMEARTATRTARRSRRRATLHWPRRAELRLGGLSWRASERARERRDVSLSREGKGERGSSPRRPRSHRPGAPRSGETGMPANERDGGRDPFERGTAAGILPARFCLRRCSTHLGTSRHAASPAQFYPARLRANFTYLGHNAPLVPGVECCCRSGIRNVGAGLGLPK